MGRFFKIGLLCLILFSVIFTGCAKKESNSKQIVIWHWMTDRDDAFQKLAKKYEEKTGVKVKFELYAPSDVYTKKVRAAAQTNTLPDIFGILGESQDIARFVKSGYVVDMTPYLDAENGKWRNIFYEKAIATNEFKEGNAFGIKPGIYGIPIDVTNIQFLYNKKIFKQAGLDPDSPPKTWDEFIKAGEKIKALGKPVIVCGFAETWIIDSIASCFAINIMGFHKYEKTIKGDVPYTDKDWIKVFELFDELSKRKFFITGIVSLVNKQSERYFSREEAAITYNGSWAVNVFKGMNPNLQYGTMLPPAINPKNPVMIQGGAGSSFFVNSTSKMKDESIKFLKWITAKEQQLFLVKETNNLPSNKYTFEAGKHGILQEFADDMDKMFHPQTLNYYEKPRVLEYMGKGIQGIILGEKTPQQLAKELQELKEKLIQEDKSFEK